MKRFLKSACIMLALAIAFSASAISAGALATSLEAGSSMATAANIPQFDTAYVSTLSEAEEVDWFKFTTVSDDAYYSVKLVNYSLPGYTSDGEIYAPNAPNIYLYDANMQQIATGNNKVTLNKKLENNATYYVKVMMGSNEKDKTGNYEISISYKYDVAPDEMENAKVIALNTTVVCSIDGVADIDWYKFTATKSGEYSIKFENHDLPGYTNDGEIYAPNAPNIYVLDVNSQQLDSGNNNVTFTLELEANAVYYIKVKMGSNVKDKTGTYSVTVSNGEEPVTPNPGTDSGEDPAPNPGYEERPGDSAALTGISIASMPYKTEYAIGEEFDDSGLAIKAAYGDGTVANKVDGFEISGFDSSEAGTCTVEVSFTDNGVTKSASFEVEIVDEEPAGNGFLSAFLNIFVIIINFFVSLMTAFL